MIEILPYILIVIGWNPAVSEQDFADSRQVVENSLMPSRQICEMEGKQFVKVHNEAGHKTAQMTYRYFCIAEAVVADQIADSLKGHTVYTGKGE